MTQETPFYQDKERLAAALAEYDGNATALARARGVHQTTIQKWRARLDLDAVVTPGPKPRVVAASPGDKVSREELLEREVSDLRSRLKRARRQDVDRAELAAILERSIERIEPAYTPATPVIDGAMTTHKFMLDWSDLHAAEVVDREEMNGINAYDWDVMLDRHDKMLKSIVSFKEKRPYPVDELIINGLGDMLSGNNHAELKETNQKVIMEAALQLGLDMAEWVGVLASHFPRLRMTGVVGNHPRTTMKPAMKKRYDNYDWMVYHIMKLRLADHANVTIEVPKAAQTMVEVFGERHLLFHGDGIRSTMPGVPWGGVMRRVAELSNQYQRLGKPITRFHVGHFHNLNIVEGGRIFMNGSVKGPDEYSLLNFGGGHNAQQLLSVYHPRRGLTETCVLDLQS
jgi:transposase-like protein